MPRSLLPTDQIVAQLARSPAEIGEIVNELGPAPLRISPGPGDWSVADILAHLRACADMWGGRRIMAMLREDHPTIRTINPRTWIHQTDYLDINVQASLTAYAAQRAELLRALHDSPDDVWSRSATITGAGKRFDSTVHIEADAIARHEALHIRQMRQTGRSIASTESS